MTVPGLFYHPDEAPRDTVHDLENLDLTPITASANSRRVAHFGYAYDYHTGAVGAPAPSFPVFVAVLRDVALRHLPDGATLDQCIINRYLPGQGISAHVDSPTYGEYICCFTFGTGATVEFTRCGKKVEVYTEPGSLYIMSGEARHAWKHEMRARKSDVVEGKKIPRGVRYSVTFRSVRRE
jgi:alkylated DNA repair dioxygenase AlkB